MLPRPDPGPGKICRQPRSWYGESCSDISASPTPRSTVSRSWYGVPGATANGYGALSEEDLHSSSVTPSKSSSRIDILKSIVSMATLSRKRSTSATTLHLSGPSAAPLIRPRKCETVVALSSLQVEPVNRLRPPNRVCSRCSSLLSMASSSRYSINTAGAFVKIDPPSPLLCKLCLVEVPNNGLWTLSQCACTFCTECMRQYVEFEINEGAYDISCPDALCDKQGVVTLMEIENLVGPDSFEKHKRFRLNREVELDKSRTWCPRAGCETVCNLCNGPERCVPQSVHCPTCSTDFCSNCRAPWHQGVPCKPEDLNAPPVPGVTFDSELIKCCPVCAVPIEKDEGCAQMMCKRCKHVFCWYCLASLDDDFLLRHYDKGPCKNKLGHSRASVIWHRTQVIGIFAGFGILLLVASPLLLLAAPCIVCCKCRVCSGSEKLDGDDDIPEES